VVRPEWDDDLSGNPQCKDCGHSAFSHRSNGACYTGGCLCGWTRNMREAASSTKCPKKNRGARVGLGTRAHLLKIPCFFCGCKAESLDHFIPRSRGGKSDRGNLVSACLTCNGMKGDKTYDELLVFCVEMETAVLRKTALRHVRTFNLWKEQAKKILAWHEKRIAAKQVSV
jgi:HNH endonuclease